MRGETHQEKCDGNRTQQWTHTLIMQMCPCKSDPSCNVKFVFSLPELGLVLGDYPHVEIVAVQQGLLKAEDEGDEDVEQHWGGHTAELANQQKLGERKLLTCKTKNKSAFIEMHFK